MKLFLVLQLILAGPPFVTFLIYAFSILFFSFSVAIVIISALASLFAAFMIGAALFVFVPVVIVAVGTATTLFCFGTVGYGAYSIAKGYKEDIGNIHAYSSGRRGGSRNATEQGVIIRESTSLEDRLRFELPKGVKNNEHHNDVNGMRP